MAARMTVGELALTDNIDPDQIPQCPHCSKPMKRWEVPAESSWDTPWMWGCFNDECSYYVKGWAWMREQFRQEASYRWRIDPSTGESGPLPVWSPEALKNRIIED